MFASLLVYLRPRDYKQPFEERYAQLEQLSESGRYSEFYATAEQLRLDTETEKQLGQVHGLVAQARAAELRHRREFGVDTYEKRSLPSNYQTIIQDYTEAVKREWVADETDEMANVFHDVGLSYWNLNESDKAIKRLEKALEMGESYHFNIKSDLVKMYLQSRPEGYLDKAKGLLEEILSNDELDSEKKAWAFVRKSEVLITQGNETQALKLLNEKSVDYRESSYSDEMELMRARALRNAGEQDLADIILRDLLKRTNDRGDIYAQVCLELGKINYEQFRDYDASQFFTNVTDTQLGKNWYVGGQLGLAQCAAMQKRYDVALDLFKQVTGALKKSPYNRVVDQKEVQNSLVMISRHLSLQKDYSRALQFMDVEMQVVLDGDIEAAERHAQLHRLRAQQLADSLAASQADLKTTNPTENEALWLQQQNNLILTHYNHAADGYMRVSELGVDQDELYGRSLWDAAIYYDKAGNVEKSIEVWHKIVREREGKPQWPLALYRLSQSYQAIGQYDDAIEYYVLLKDKHPNSPEVFKGMVALAKCYIAKATSGDQSQDFLESAETLLKSVLSNLAVTPKANAYRDALFELGHLYYTAERYPDAINVYIEGIDRYPNDPLLGKALFLVGDSYRRSGLALENNNGDDADPIAAVLKEQASARKQQYIANARSYFTRAIKFYDAIPDRRRSGLDDMYLEYSWLYRADCLFDLGLYRQAAEAYEETALRYQLTSTALASFVQIINCKTLLGKSDEAKSTQKRAIWQLRKMPDDAFAKGKVQFSRAQWQNWFQGLETTGLW